MNKLILLSIVCILLLSSCSYHFQNEGQAVLFSGSMEKSNAWNTDADLSSLSLGELKNQCTARWLKREYAKFNQCFDRFLAKNKVAGQADTTLIVYAMKADLELKLHNYKQALHYSNIAANKMLESIEDAYKLQYKARTPTIGLDVDFIIFGSAPLPYLTGAVAALAMHNTELAKKYLNRFDHYFSTVTDRLPGFINGLGVMKNERKKLVARVSFESGYYQQALNELDNLSSDDRNNNSKLYLSSSINLLFLKASSHFYLQHWKKAKHAFDQLLKEPKAPYYLMSGYWEVLLYRARLHVADQEYNKAISKLEEAVNYIELQRSSIHADKSKIGFAGGKQEVYGLLVKMLIDQGHNDEAFSYAERGKARALVDMLASKKKFSGGDVANISEQDQLLAQLDIAEAKANVRGGSEKGRSTTRGLVIKNRIALMQQAPELSSLVSVSAPDIKEIQSLLPQDETLIEYYGSGDDLFAFVVSKNGIQGVKLNAAGLNESVAAFREAILDVKSDVYKREGNKLYQRIIAPVVSAIGTENITIVPHGALHYLPFSALASSNAFLIDQYSLRILPSASVMKFLKKNQNKVDSLLVFGNPDLGESKYDLPGAQKEAEMIVRKSRSAKLLIRGQATETAVKNYGNSFKYLHFASHGTFNADKPLQSGLLLAKDSQNDGILTVGELYDLNLNADLVTLSACETGLGKVANGDDVVGFTRGFLYAGASSIVSSLWQVDDAATSVLMQSFYDNLSKMDKRSALRNAQLSTKAKYHHPYYWAAFQMTGAVQ